jgi:hypothetical protein
VSEHYVGRTVLGPRAQLAAEEEQRSHTAKLLASAGWMDRAWDDIAAERAARRKQQEEIDGARD